MEKGADLFLLQIPLPLKNAQLPSSFPSLFPDNLYINPALLAAAIMCFLPLSCLQLWFDSFYWTLGHCWVSLDLNLDSTDFLFY